MLADAGGSCGDARDGVEVWNALGEAGGGGGDVEEELASEKEWGDRGGKVLVPSKTVERTVNAARLAADVMGVAAVLIARTDAESAKLITSDVDERDHPFIDRSARTEEGFHPIRSDDRMAYCIARGLAFAAYADLLWMETSKPNLEQARTLDRKSTRLNSSH